MPETAIERIEVVTVAPKVSTRGNSQIEQVPFSESRFHRTMACITAALVCLLAVMFRVEHISIAGSLVGDLQPIAMLGITGMYCHYARLAGLRDKCFLIAWVFVLFILLPLPQYLAGRLGTALPQDMMLVRIDQFLGVNVGSIVLWARAHAFINVALGACYTGLIPYTFLAFALPTIFGKFASARSLLLSAMIGVCLASIIMALFPTTLPAVVYGYEPYDTQKRYLSELAALRSHLPYVIDREYSSGMIEFPSFHVALALMSTRALWVFRWLRAPAIAMAVLVSISTVTTGMHYGADVLGGVVLAALSGILSNRLLCAYIHSKKHGCTPA